VTAFISSLLESVSVHPPEASFNSTPLTSAAWCTSLPRPPPLGGFRCSCSYTSPLTFDPAWSSSVSVACTGPLIVAVHHDVGGLHFAVDARIGRYHQRARLVRQSGDIAADHAVNPQAAAENHVASMRVVTPIRLSDPVLRLCSSC